MQRGRNAKNGNAAGIPDRLAGHQTVIKPVQFTRSSPRNPQEAQGVGQEAAGRPTGKTAPTTQVASERRRRCRRKFLIYHRRLARGRVAGDPGCG